MLKSYSRSDLNLFKILSKRRNFAKSGHTEQLRCAQDLQDLNRPFATDAKQTLNFLTNYYTLYCSLQQQQRILANFKSYLS